MRSIAPWLAMLVFGCVDAPIDPALSFVDEVPPSGSAPPGDQQPFAAPICAQLSCGFAGTPEACGMQDDGCGGMMWCGPCACPATFVACEVDLPVIADVLVEVGPSQLLVAETSDLSPGADSVLHLLIGTGTQIAFSDDISPVDRASRIAWTAPPTGANVRIVARAKSAATTGTATLSYQSAAVPIALVYPEVAVASTRAGDRLQPVALPSPTSPGTQVVYRLSGANIVARSSGSNLSIAIPSTGTTRYLVGRAAFAGPSVPGRVLRNDAAIVGHDPDEDGVGSDLEAALGTCSTLSGTATDRFGVGFACALASDARDTDGDGLADGWEVLGALDLAPAVPLPRFGADPRHKDLFVEVDYGQATAGELEEAVAHAEVRTWEAVWGDRVGELTSAQRALRRASIRNPDGRAGVRIHVDSGVVAPSQRWAALHGDWGGHGVVPPAPGGGRLHYGIARDAYMAESRRGIFRYALRAASGGGQASGNAFVYGGDGRTAAHESGHTARLKHEGLPDPVLAINCKPNYPSVMSYAFQGNPDVGFADGSGAPALNNAALVEWHGADPVTQGAFLDMLEATYELVVDHATGDIDWNRDGAIAPPGQTVEAFANNRPHGECEGTRAGSTDPAGPHQTTVGPALARLHGRTLIFTAGAGAVGWTLTTSPLSCKVPTPGPCASFDASGAITGLDSALGVDAVRLAGDTQLLLVGVDAGHRLRWARITGFPFGAPLVTSVQSLGVLGAIEQPTLVNAEDGAPALFYRDATGALWQRRYLAVSDSWTAAQAVLDAGGQPVRMTTTGSPGAVLARPLDLSSTALAMHLAFAASANGCMQLWHRAPAGHWVRPSGKLPACTTSTPWHATIARPALAWVPDPKDQTYGGRLHYVYIPDSSDPDETNLRQYTSVSTGGVPRLELQSQYDNQWAYSHGIDLMYEPGTDDNLRAAWTHTIAPDDVEEQLRVRFDPKADGISDHGYTGANDWRILRHGVCANLIEDQSQPVTCPTAP